MAAHDLLTPEVHRSRIDRLRDRAVMRGIDALLLSDPVNVFYFAAGGQLSPVRMLWLVVPTEGPCTLVVPRIEAPVAARASWVADQREWVEWPEAGVADHWSSALADVLRERGCTGGRLGIEFGFVTVGVLDILRGCLPAAEFVDAGPLAAEIRRRKAPVELAILRTAGHVAAAQLAAARLALAEGVPEYELTLAARAAGTRAAAEALGPGYHLMSPVVTGLHVVGAGPDRSAMAHARASTYRIRRDDIVQVCFCGQVYFMYNLGFDRPLLVEEAVLTAEQTRLLDVALDAHDAALEAIRPGVRASHVHAAATGAIAEAGWLRYRAHRTGRSIGIAGGEQPELRESDETALEPGMTLTVEPGIYIPGVGGARFGDTVAVTETGYETLTPASYGWRGR